MFRLCAGKVILSTFLCTANKKILELTLQACTAIQQSIAELGFIYMQQQSLHSCPTISSVNIRMYELRSV